MLRRQALSGLLLCAVLAPVSAFADEMVAAGELARAPSEQLRIELSGACTGEDAVIRIANRGSKWPRTGAVKLYFADDQSPIGERNLRLAQDQQVQLRLDGKVFANRPVAVWVEPHWYARPFTIDAHFSCGA